MPLPPAFDWTQLPPEHQRVLLVLVQHQGRDRAVPVPEVARRAGVNDRTAQNLVKALVEDFGVPIGSAFHVPVGWYLCASDQEREENRAALRGRALSILRRARAFDARHFNQLSELFSTQIPLVPPVSRG